jgi:class 3 adenylate cyclase/tetratricopeptide (TPR) repeat protein
MCASCGQGNPPGSRFCDACGQALAAPVRPDTPTTGASPTSPQSYTPKHLAEKILASRAGLEGERKQVTALFADIVSSTELIHGRDAEEAQALLDGVVKMMMDAVHRYEGTISRLMGDGLMALFGAPLAHEDHALRAYYAALAIQEVVSRHAEQTRREQGVALAIRIGLSAGEVIVRAIRDDLHMDFTAMGQTVHLAARMEQLATPGTITLTPETLALVEGYVQVRSLGPLPVKGLPEPIEVFELLGTGQARTRLQAAAGRGLTRFVGRDEEIGALYGALSWAEDGRGQLVALVGEPGVGKSRLVWEVTHSHRVQRWTVLESGSVSYGKATMYLPVIDLVKAYCRIEPRDDERLIREKVTGKLLTLDRALEPYLPPLLALLDALPLSSHPPRPEHEVGDAVSSVAWEALDPTQRRRRTLDAVKRLLLRESQEQPLLLVFEDLHWIDSESQALLDSFVESLPNSRVLLLVNYRPEYSHGWGSKTYYRQVRVDPLPATSADELLVSLLGDDPSLGPLNQLLARQTEGNPFFLEESVRTLVETGALTGERGAYRLPRPLTEVRVPPTVQAILAARIDRLAPSEKALLQTAAVIGKDVPDVLLRSVTDLAEEELRRGLAALQAAEFIYEARLFPELEHTFKHALTHEVAYGSLLGERRKSLHARVVESMERLYGDRLDEQVDLLAHHAQRGEVWDKSLLYARRAGDRASARSVNRAATAHFEQALAAIGRLPESRPLQELSIDLRIQLRQALAGAGRDDDALAYLREAEPIAQALGDRRRQARIAAQVSFCLHIAGDHEGAVAAGQSARSIAEATGDQSVLMVARHRLGQVYWNSGQIRLAIPFFREVIRAIPDDQVAERFDMGAAPSVEARVALADCLAKLGSLAEARSVLNEGIALAESLDNPSALMTACLAAGYVYSEGDHLIESIPAIERGHALTVSLEVPAYTLASASALGLAYALAGRTTEAIPLVDLGAEIAASSRSRQVSGRWAVARGEAYLRAGQVDAAHTQAEFALGISTTRHARGDEAFAFRLLGEITASGEPVESGTAEAHYRKSLTLAEELGMRPLAARCHLGLGKLFRRTGRTEEARTELMTALAMIREMEMTFWLPEAEKELAQTDAAGSEG